MRFTSILRFQFITSILIYVFASSAAQASEARLYIIYTNKQPNINRVLIVRIYIYICNELIEETARGRKLIFGMRESFFYGSTKF